MIFYEYSDSLFKKSSGDVEKKLGNSFRGNTENASELISEAFLKLGVFAEVVGSSTSFCKAEGVDLPQNVASNDFRCLKGFDRSTKK